MIGYFLCGCAVAAGLLMTSVARAAEAARVDLTPSAVVVHNFVQSYVMRDGKPFVFGAAPALCDHNGSTYLRPVGKYSGHDVVELWFPYPQPATVSGLCFQMINRAPTDYEVQSWDSGQWRTVVRVDEKNPHGSKVDFPAVTTHGLRLVIARTDGAVFDDYRLAELSVLGTQAITEKPAQAQWTLATGKPLNVVSLGEMVHVNGELRLAGQTGPARISWQWTDWYMRPVGPSMQKDITLTDDGSVPLSFDYKPERQGPYFLRATVWRNDAVASQAVFLVGVRDPQMDDQQRVEPLKPRRGGRVRDENDLIGPGKMMFSSEIYHHSSPLHYLPPDYWFEKFEQSHVDMVGALVNFEAFMPLPGVYNFDYLDTVVQRAEDHHLKLETGFWRYWFDGPNRPQWWLEDELIRDQDGNPGTGFNHAFSYWGPRYREYVRRSVALITTRYKDHPAVGVWNFQPFGHVDWGWMGDLRLAFDYSRFGKEAFHRYLQQKLGLDLAAVSKRYGQDFASWDQVELPRPLWMDKWKTERTDTLFDTRPIWLDFVEYRHWSCAETARMVADTIRGIDPVRPLGTWMSVMSGYGEDANTFLREYGIPGGSNGAEWTEYTRMSIVQRRDGRPSRQEHGGQVDSRRPDPVGEMNAMIFNNNIFKTKYFNFVFPVFEKNPAWWDVFANPRCREILTDMADSEIPVSPIAAMYSYDTDWFEGRNSLSFIELDRWWRMLTWGQFMTSQHWIEWYSQEGRLSELAGKKLVIDNHCRIMRANAEDALYNYVVGGGSLVLFADSGELTYGDTTSQWRLLRRLGYDNVESLRSKQLHGVLKPVADNGVFKSFDEMPVGQWAALNKPDATVLATIDGKPGAITWNAGKGKVLLISGKEGDPDLFSLVNVEVNDRKNYWTTRVAARQNFIRLVTPLYQDIAGFAGEIGDATVTMTGAPRWYYKQKNQDLHFVCMLNEGDSELTGARVRMTLPEGVYRLQWWSLNGYVTLADKNSGELAKGLDLPGVAAHRMAVLRAERIK